LELGASERPGISATVVGMSDAVTLPHTTSVGGSSAADKREQSEASLVSIRFVWWPILFCRTLEEAELVLAELSVNGPKRGGRGLEVYVMCETPNNVILAKQFADLFRR
jgi:hypothetical protein